MFHCRNLVLTIILALLAGESLGFWYWPFSVNTAVQEPILESTEYEYDEYANSSVKRIAIIGAGAAGSSSAYHLQKYASESDIAINVTVIERSSYIGGRSTTVNAYGNVLEPVELGASIFVEVNTILKNASREFGLSAQSSRSDVEDIMGIWNGEEFVYTQTDSDWKYWDIAKLLWKYGLAPFKTQRLMKTVVGSFLKLYERPFFPFRSLSDRVEELGLQAITSVTGEQYLTANGISSSFATDIIQASTRVNYGQNLNFIHGLETMVCMAIEGAMQIQGGNWQIFDSMVKASNSTVLLNHTVTEITKSNDRYRVKTTTKDATGLSHTHDEPFDTIILAAPLQYTDIKLPSDLLTHTPDTIPYVTLHVTLFTSPHALNPVFFGLPSGSSSMPNTILTTLPPNTVPTDFEKPAGPAGFFSISTLRKVINPETLEWEYLYKIFSPSALTSEFLSGILGAAVPEDLSTVSSAANNTITWYHPHVWHSYPYELPRVTFEEIELAQGIYYTSGIESFISTMETSALMGKNVARLVVDDYLAAMEPKEELGEGMSADQIVEVPTPKVEPVPQVEDL